MTLMKQKGLYLSGVVSYEWDRVFYVMHLQVLLHPQPSV